MRKRFVKLVRDGIPEFVGDSTVSYEPIEDDVIRVSALRRKLVEEALEYLQNPTEEELADVLEVVIALSEIDMGVDLDHIDIIRQSKERERGGFRKRLGMYVYTTAGAEHEGEHA